MSKVSVSQVFATEPAQLWGIVGDPGGFASWHPAVAQSPLSEGGRVRVCSLADGAEIHEEITEHSDAQLAYTYRIVESPLPIAGYTSTIRVTGEEGGARLTWESDFDVVGAPPAEVEGMIRGLYEAGLGSLASQLG